MKKIITLITLSFLISSAFGQGQWYSGVKFSIYGEYLWAPTSVASKTTYSNSWQTFNDSTSYTYQNLNVISMFNIIYSLRYNILEPVENFSVGINTAPSLGITISEDGIGSLNIPAYLSFNLGAGSNFDCQKKWGTFVGVGYEISKINLINLDTKEYGSSFNNDYETFPLKTLWTEPMVIAGLRMSARGVQLFEFSFKYGFGSNRGLPEEAKSEDLSSPRTMQFSVGAIINR